jgi:hypothetical protein
MLIAAAIDLFVMRLIRCAAEINNFLCVEGIAMP